MKEYFNSSNPILKKYFNNLNPVVEKYFKILSDEIPEFLYDYISTPEMMRLDGVGSLSGCDYIKFIRIKFWYSTLTHSIAVALIIWHFTKDKKQTLAGLFHDIAAPAFKHCIDFLNGDYINQESIEQFTSQIIKNSKEIMSLLERDGIALEEVNNYKKYPIADNNVPQLSADRLEYTFADSLVITREWSLDEIKKMYDNLEILKNEEGIDEIGFTDETLADRFVDGASLTWYLFQSNEEKLKTQFFADVIKKMIEINELTKDDLYKLSEKEIIKKIENCKEKSISEAFKKFRNVETIDEGEEKPLNKYTVSLDVKRRYVVPLVKDKRVTEVTEFSKDLITVFSTYSSFKYGWFDFNF